MTPKEVALRAKAQTAVKGLASAIDSLQQRYKLGCDKRKMTNRLTPERQQAIQQSVKRIQAWLTRLLLKQASLSVAMECLVDTTWPIWKQWLEQILRQHNKQKKESKNLLLQQICPLLEQLFTQLIRLHDALILCLSGECRHAGDIRAAKRTKYPSLLNQQSRSSDGVSRLYSKDLNYSGEAWDDFHDATNGIKKQLLEQLAFLVPTSQREAMWDWLVERGGLAFDAIMDEIQNDKETIQADCTAFKNRVILELTLLFQKYGTNIFVELTLADKMEKFVIRMDSLEWKFERMADTFQITDSLGVLPLLYSVEEWKGVLLPPSTEQQSHHQPASKKKRKIIIDSSESEDDEVSKKPLATTTNRKDMTKKVVASGLVVSVQQAKDPQTTNAPSLSVNEIKQQMGVNVEQLAESRQVMEDEEAVTKRAANFIDLAPTDDVADLAASKHQVKRLRKILQTAILKVKPDDVIWNAREYLREACMNAGNACLNEANLEELDHAIDFFDEAQNLVREQQQMLQGMTDVSADPEFSSQSVSHRCMLLLGRAQANSGIARVELSRLLRTHDRKPYEREAKQMLEAAFETVQLLMNEVKQYGTTTDAVIDLVNARELTSLIMRWLGTILWLQWDRGTNLCSLEDSLECFRKAADVLGDMDPADSMYDDELFEATLQALVQGYCAWTTFGDLAAEALEVASVSSIRKDPGKYDNIHSEAIKAFEAAVVKSQSLYHLASISSDINANETFLNDQEVLRSNDLNDYAKQINDYWQGKRELSFKSVEHSDRGFDLGRSEVPLSDLAPPLPCTGRFVINGASRKRKPKKQHAVYSSSFGVSKHNDDNDLSIAVDDTSNTRRRYRPWGDELLPQMIDEFGRSVPKLVYPAVAPEMPDELKAQLAENLRRAAALTL